MKEREKENASRKGESHREGSGHTDSAQQQPAISTSTKIRQSSGRARPGQRGKVQVLIPACQHDDAALLKAGREWLVPLLIRDFLLERGLEPVSGIDSTKNRHANYGMPGQGARATTRGLN